MTDTDVRSGERRTTSARRRPAGTGPRNRPADTGPGAPGADVAVDGLLDIVDDKAWLRADGYLPGPRRHRGVLGAGAQPRPAPR
ncbi:hypothetical protein GCM10020358_34560 [Amorphoplanes nipponensis]